MKKLTKTKLLIVFAIIFTLCFGFYLTKDEPLNPEAAQWITEASTFKENDAYYLLFGISANEADNPLLVGKQVYKLYKNKPPLWFPSDKSDEVNEKGSLALPKHEGLFCFIKGLDCWNYIFANTDKTQNAVQTYSVIKERYQNFIKSKDYHTNLISLSAIPPYNYLLDGNQIILLQAINRAETDPHSAIKSIQTDLADLRRQLETADNLIFKLIINAMAAKDIQAITLLEQKYGISAPITRLTTDEKSLNKPFKYELAYQRNIMAQLADGLESQDHFENWITRLEFYFLYNQNRTTNEALNHYKFLLGLNFLNYSKIEEFVNTHKRKSSFHVKNVVGTSPAGISELDSTYTNYYLRMIDTDLKIMLSNEINAQRSTGTINLSKIQNPYFNNPTHPYWSSDGKQICLDKPKLNNDENTENKVCLIVKL